MIINENCECCKSLAKQLYQLKAENNVLKDLNIRLENQRETYWEEYQKLKKALQEIKSLCLEQNLKADFFACEILQKCEVLDD